MRKRIFTWHIHGSYLYYLSEGNFDLYIPVNEEKNEGYYGRGLTFPFGPNVIEVPAGKVRHHDFDLILFQTDRNYLIDQYEILSGEQRRLPKIFLKHDPPTGHPTDQKLVVDDPEVMVVHVTHFNNLMWDNGSLETRVISHGVTDTGLSWTGEIPKGLVVINNLPSRGRLIGFDLYNQAKREIPLDVIGMGNETIGGYEVLHPGLPEFIRRYRFIFNPIRYTSLGLAICEAMMSGMPVVGMATTEMSVTIQNGVNGYVHTDISYLIEKMKLLLENREEAERIGNAARETAKSLFNIQRFVCDWECTFSEVIERNKVTSSNE